MATLQVRRTDWGICEGESLLCVSCAEPDETRCVWALQACDEDEGVKEAAFRVCAVCNSTFLLLSRNFSTS